MEPTASKDWDPITYTIVNSAGAELKHVVTAPCLVLSENPDADPHGGYTPKGTGTMRYPAEVLARAA